MSSTTRAAAKASRAPADEVAKPTVKLAKATAGKGATSRKTVPPTAAPARPKKGAKVAAKASVTKPAKVAKATKGSKVVKATKPVVKAKAAAKAAAKRAPAKAKTTAKSTKAKTTAKSTEVASTAKSNGKASTATKGTGAAAAEEPSTSRSRIVPALGKGPAAPTRPAPPKRKGPLDAFLRGQRDLLIEERTTYLRQATSLKAEADLLMAEREPGDVQFDEESGEGDTIAVERERDLALSAQATAAVEEIDIALAKLEDGTYGVCEQCYATIPTERLEALPAAALCVQCKTAGFSLR